MTDSEVIQIIWGNPELQSKFEIDPYGLSQRPAGLITGFQANENCDFGLCPVIAFFSSDLSNL